jgi:hypothetical protein
MHGTRKDERFQPQARICERECWNIQVGGVLIVSTPFQA